MPEKAYEVEVIVHEQVSRSCTVRVKVHAHTPQQAAFIAQGDAEQKAKEGAPEVSKWSEPSYHYESETHQTNEL